MTDLQKTEFLARMSALTDEEKALAISLFPNEMLIAELGKRLSEVTSTVNRIRAVLEVSEENSYGKE